MATTHCLESDARYVLFGTLVEDKRVLDLGCGDGLGLIQLVNAGAVELVGTTSSSKEARAALEDAGIEGVEVLPDFSPPLGFETHAFDVIICHDLPDRIKSNPEWVKELRRVLDPEGYLVLAVATGEGQFLSELAGLRGHSGLNYEEAYEALAETFGEASIFGQSPVVASLFWDVQSEEEDPGLTLDGSLLEDEGEDPGWYVLVFGPTPPRRDDLLLVRLGFQRAVKAVRGGGPARPMPVAPRLSQDDIDALRSDLVRTKRELETVNRDMEVLQRDLELKGHHESDAGDLESLWGHAERTLQTQEETLRAERTRTARAEDELHRARLTLARLESDLAATAGLQAHLAYARQVVERQDQEIRQIKTERPTTAPVAVADASAPRLDAVMLEQSQRLLADLEGHFRRATQRARDAEEQLAIARLEAYQAQNQLQKQTETRAQDLQGLRAELSACQEELERKEARLREVQERAAEAERTVGEQRDRIAELMQSLAGAEQMFERTKAELLKIETGATERIDEQRALTEALVQQTALAAQHKLETELARVEAERNAALSAALKDAEERAAQALADANTRAAERAAELSAELDRVRTELDLARQGADGKGQALAAAEERLAQAEGELSELRAALEANRRKDDELLEAWQQTETKDNELTRLQGELAQQTEALAQAQKQADERAQALAEAQKQANERAQALAEAQKQADERAQALAEVQREANERAQTQQRELEARIESLRQSLNAEAEARLVEVRGESNAQQSRMEAEFEQRLAALRQENETKLAAAKALADKAQADVAAEHAAQLQAARDEARQAEQAAFAEKLADVERRAKEQISAIETQAEERLEQARAEAQARIDEIDARVRRAEEERARIERELLASHENTPADADTTARLIAAEEKLREALGRLSQSEAEHAAALEQVKNEARQKISLAKERFAAANKARENAVAERDALAQKVAAQRKEAIAFRDEAVSHLERLEEEQSQNAALRAELKQTQLHLAATEENLAALAEERNAMAAEIQRLTNALYPTDETAETKVTALPNLAGSRDSEFSENTIVDASITAIGLGEETKVVKKMSKDHLDRDIEVLQELEELTPSSSPRR